MSAEKIIYKILSTDAGVIAVTNRIYPVNLPQGANLPAIVYQQISDPSYKDIAGVTNYGNTRMQLSIFSGTFSAAKDLAKKVRAALNNYSGTVDATEVHRITVEDEIDDFEPTTQFYRIIVDTIVRYTKS